MRECEESIADAHHAIARLSAVLDAHYAAEHAFWTYQEYGCSLLHAHQADLVGMYIQRIYSALT